MRCSSCEPLLDRYVEGTLKAPEMSAVSDHLRACAGCRDLLAELKVVDALLETSKPVGLPENFTFAVMAETNGMPAPRARQHPIWSFLVLYVAAAWAAVLVAIAVSGAGAPALFASVSAWLARLAGGAALAGSAASHGIAHAVPALAAFGFGVFLVDLAVAAAFGLLYFVIRPRVAARLASSEALP